MVTGMGTVEEEEEEGEEEGGDEVIHYVGIDAREKARCVFCHVTFTSLSLRTDARTLD
jgi:hypothetical protein